jgi:hypothetical protein
MHALGGEMSETSSHSDKMQKLQQMRVTLVLLLSEENTKLMSQQQRVSGKEIEVMCAERNHADGTSSSGALEQVYEEDRVAKDALNEIITEIDRMEDILAKIDVDIGEMRQS